MVMQLPVDDKLSQTRQEMTSRLAVLMGGRVAEELAFGEENVTSGASSDIQMATRIARAMVTSFGLSDVIGPVDYADNSDPYTRPNQVSEDTSKKIEEEVRKLVQKGMDEARRILTDHKDDWTTIAEGLLEYETLSGTEITDLMNGKPPSRPEDPDEPSATISTVPVIGKKRTRGGEAEGDNEPEPA